MINNHLKSTQSIEGNRIDDIDVDSATLVGLVLEFVFIFLKWLSLCVFQYFMAVFAPIIAAFSVLEFWLKWVIL